MTFHSEHTTNQIFCCVYEYFHSEYTQQNEGTISLVHRELKVLTIT